MFCGNCGNTMEDGMTTCPLCGWTKSAPKMTAPAGNSAMSAVSTATTAAGEEGPMPQLVATGSETFDNCVSYIGATGASEFVSPDEKPLYSLRHGTLGNLSAGRGWSKDDAIITDKRLYYSCHTGFFTRVKDEEMVNLEDITGVKIKDHRPVFVLFLSVMAILVFLYAVIADSSSPLSLIALGAAVVLFIIYICCCASVLSIEYAGGFVEFRAKSYGLNAIRSFQRCIYAAKENLENKQ